jgi:hypothetical protein
MSHVSGTGALHRRPERYLNGSMNQLRASRSFILNARIEWCCNVNADAAEHFLMERTDCKETINDSKAMHANAACVVIVLCNIAVKDQKKEHKL